MENGFGKGRAILIAPDITGSIVRVQQGVGVTRDKAPAPDGSACLADNILKAGDGCVLDWIFDRQPLPGVPGYQAYLQPIADQWREVLLRSIFYLAREASVALPLLWLYPRDLPAIAHLTHDTDGNDPEAAQRMIDLLAEEKVRSTWYIQPPGYPLHILDSIRSLGCELGMHFDAMSEGLEWSEDEFDRQWKTLVDLFAGENPLSNRNHYLRWEGDMEFFEWCDKRGLRWDASKGATKSGEVGYNFGTCHPYFPVDFQGSLLDVMEMCTPTQDFVAFAPPELGAALLNAALKHHGMFPLLFHPYHLHKTGVADALRGAIAAGKQAGLEWWTAREISEWERARRTIRWSSYSQESGRAVVEISAGAALPEANILWLAPDPAEAEVNGVKSSVREVKRWGFMFRSVTVSIQPNVPLRVQIDL